MRCAFVATDGTLAVYKAVRCAFIAADGALAVYEAVRCAFVATDGTLAVYEVMHTCSTADGTLAVFPIMVNILICVTVYNFILAVGDRIHLLATENGIILRADGLSPCAAQLTGNLTGSQLIRSCLNGIRIRCSECVDVIAVGKSLACAIPCTEGGHGRSISAAYTACKEAVFNNGIGSGACKSHERAHILGDAVIDDAAVGTAVADGHSGIFIDSANEAARTKVHALIAQINGAAPGAVFDDGFMVGIADKAADTANTGFVVLHGYIHIRSNVADGCAVGIGLVGVRTGCGTDDTANVGNIVGCDGYVTVNGEVLHRAQTDFAEEARTGAVCVDIQPRDGVALTVKVAAEVVVAFTGGADGSPEAVFKVDVRRQLCACRSVNRVDIFGKPEKVAAVCDLIITVNQFRRFMGIANGTEAVVVEPIMTDGFVGITVFQKFIFAVGDLIYPLTAGDRIFLCADGLPPCAAQLISYLAGGELFVGDIPGAAADLAAALCTLHAGCIGVAVDDAADTVGAADIASGIGNQITAASLCADGNIIGIAVADGTCIVAGCDTANNIAVWGKIGINDIAVFNQRAVQHLAHDSRGADVLCVIERKAHIVHAQIFYRRAQSSAEQTCGAFDIACSRDGVVSDHMSLTVEGTGVDRIAVIGCIVVQIGGADGDPLSAFQIDVCCQNCARIIFAVVNSLRK